MDDDAIAPVAPAGWLEVLAESDADIAAGRVVPGEIVRQGLRDALARLEAKRAAGRRPGATSSH